MFFLGIFIGSATVSSYYAVSSIPSISTSIFGIISSCILFVVLGTFWGLILAVPLGIIPAILTGIGYWLILKYFTNKNPAKLRRFLIGSSLGFFAATASYSIQIYGSESMSISSVVHFGAIGIISGGLCALNITQNFYQHVFEEKIKSKLAS